MGTPKAYEGLRDGSTILPVYIICDTSESMGWPVAAEGSRDEDLRPIDILNESIRELTRDILSGPSTSTAVQLSIISFDSDARTNLPLTSVTLQAVSRMTELTAGGCTNYAAALAEFESRLNRDKILRKNGESYRAVAFFLTDGQPTDKDGRPTDHADSWLPIWRRLCDRERPPRIIPAALGKTNMRVLEKLAYYRGVEFPTKILSRGDDVSQAIRGTFDAISRSLQGSRSAAIPDSLSLQEKDRVMDDIFMRELNRVEEKNDYDSLMQDYL